MTLWVRAMGRARNRPLRIGLAALIGGLLLLTTGAQPAYAHAELLATTPTQGAVLDTAPTSAELRFNEPVGAVNSGFRLFSPDGTATTLDASARDETVTIPLPPDLPDGRYSLAYRVVSADSHPVTGILGFQIGNDTTTATPPVVTTTPAATEAAVTILTGLHYLGLLGFAGLLLFRGLVLRPTPDPPPDRLPGRLWAIALAGSLLLIPASALRVTGGQLWELFPPGTWLGSTPWQPAAATLIVGLSGAGALLTLRTTRLALPLTIVALTAPLLVGHTQTTQPTWLAITADLGHLVAGAFWTGGLAGLIRHLTAAHRNPDADPQHLAATVTRFSGYALASVIVLAASGLTMAILILDNPTALLDTSYGRTLLLKLGILAPVLTIAGWNRYVLLPRLTAEPDNHHQWAELTRTLRNEAPLLVAVLAVTGALTNTSPGHHDHNPASTAQPRTIPLQASSQGLDITGTLSPATTGQNLLTITLHYNGEPLRTKHVTISARLPEQDLGPIQTTPVLDPTTEEYTARLQFPVAGNWQLEVSTRVDTFTKPHATLQVAIP